MDTLQGRGSVWVTMLMVMVFVLKLSLLTMVANVPVASAQNNTNNNTSISCESFGINISTTVISGSFTGDITWFANSQRAFIRTSTGQLYLTRDGGQTWQNQNPFLLTSDQVIDGQSGVQYNWEEGYATADPLTFVFWGTGGRIWTTIDGGDSYTFNNVSSQGLGNLDWIIQHPTQSGWMLGAQYVYEGGGPVYDTVWLSQDLGATWTMLNTYVFDYYWGDAGFGPVPDTRLYMTFVTPAIPGSYQWTPDNYANNLYAYSDDLWQTYLILAEGYVEASVWYWEQRVLFLLDYGTLYVTRDSGYTWYELFFPATKNPSTWAFMEVNNQTATLFVTGMGNPSSGDIYVTDYQVAWVTETNVPCTFTANDFLTDWTPGYIPGAYMANTYPSSLDTSTFVSWAAHNSLQYSKISTSYPCSSSSCGLNLYGSSTSLNLPVSPLFSDPTVPGFYVGTGSTGTSEVVGSEPYDMFFSRDAGFSWSFITSSSYYVAFANRGSLGLLVDEMAATVSNITYTLDQFLTQQECSLSVDGSSLALSVYGIIAEPTGNATSLILYGPSSSNSYQLTYLDFSALNTRLCEGWDTPDTNTSDYETWYPAGKGNCVLGVQYAVVRRKQDAACWDPRPTTTRQVSVCPCTQLDYICDLCFMPQGNSCVLAGPCPSGANPTLPPDYCVGTYNQSIGYRLIPGDQCDVNAGLNLVPQPAPCPSGNGGGDSSGDGGVGLALGLGLSLGIGGMVTIAILIIAGAALLMRYKDRLPSLSNIPYNLGLRRTRFYQEQVDEL
jgi:hypothetical protein